MAFKPGDRVRWSGDKTGTVLSAPRQCSDARGDPFTGVGVEVMPDKVDIWRWRNPCPRGDTLPSRQSTSGGCR